MHGKIYSIFLFFIMCYSRLAKYNERERHRNFIRLTKGSKATYLSKIYFNKWNVQKESLAIYMHFTERDSALFSSNGGLRALGLVAMSGHIGIAPPTHFSVP